MRCFLSILVWRAAPQRSHLRYNPARNRMGAESSACLALVFYAELRPLYFRHCVSTRVCGFGGKSEFSVSRPRSGVMVLTYRILHFAHARERHGPRRNVAHALAPRRIPPILSTGAKIQSPCRRLVAFYGSYLAQWRPVSCAASQFYITKLRSAVYVSFVVVLATRV